MNNKNFNIWNGIFSSFGEANGNNAFNSKNEWCDNLTSKLIDNIHEYDSIDYISSVTKSKDYPLSIVLALISTNNPLIRVIDFGGGLAFEYLSAKKSLGDTVDLEYYVIENQSVVENSAKHLKRFNNLHFSCDLPNLQQVDCVHIGSTLQYIDDWQSLIKSLINYQAGYFVFSDLLAGEITSYITTQEYYGSKIPVRFINIHEIINFMQDYGYKLIFKSLYEANILGKYGKLPQENLPQQYQLEHGCNLIFNKE